VHNAGALLEAAGRHVGNSAVAPRRLRGYPIGFLLLPECSVQRDAVVTTAGAGWRASSTADHLALCGPQDLIDVYVRLAQKSKALLDLGHMRSAEETRRRSGSGIPRREAGGQKSWPHESELPAIAAVEGEAKSLQFSKCLHFRGQ
jgi:hypothetical protein